MEIQGRCRGDTGEIQGRYLPPGLEAVGGPHAFLMLELAWELRGLG